MAATKHSLPEAEANSSSEASRPSKKLKVKDLPKDTQDESVETASKEKKKKDKKEKKHKNRDKSAKESEEPAVAVVEETLLADEEKPKKKKKKDKHRQTEVPEKGEAETETANDSKLNDNSIVEGEEKEKKRKDKKDKKDKKEKKEKKDKKDKKQADAGPTTETTTATPGQFYVQSAALTKLPQSEIDSFLEQHSIIVTDPRSGAETLRPIIDFAQLPSTDLLKKSPFGAYKTPTPIQAASWPFTLLRRDVIGVAETGSGKTMAFALPCVEALSTIRKRCVKAVVVSPTRELAMQTHAQMAQLGELVGVKCVCLYGGASKEEQRMLLQRGADVIVATPGRLRDFMSDGTVVLKDARFVVLDEADRMLDKGFEDDIKEILSSTPPREQRQTLMFTATWPASVQALASSFMIDPVKITIGSSGKETSGGAVELQANSRIVQHVEVIEPWSKEQRLLQLVKQHQQGSKKDDRILVFCLYKKEATRVENFLSQRGVRVTGIHGDLRQEQRTRSLEAFKAGTTPVLVATDVAARGLDIPEVKLVINVTFPLTIEDYVHRIGRTGRAGKVGEAITFFTEQDKTHSGSLINILKGANQPVPEELLKFGTTVKKKAHSTYGAFFKDVDMTKTATKIVFDD